MNKEFRKLIAKDEKLYDLLVGCLPYPSGKLISANSDFRRIFRTMIVDNLDQKDDPVEWGICRGIHPMRFPDAIMGTLKSFESLHRYGGFYVSVQDEGYTDVKMSNLTLWSGFPEEGFSFGYVPRIDWNRNSDKALLQTLDFQGTLEKGLVEYGALPGLSLLKRVEILDRNNFARVYEIEAKK